MNELRQRTRARFAAWSRQTRQAGGLLLLKVWRDAWALGGTTRSLIVLVAIGTCLYVLFSQAQLNLEDSYTTFYENMNFGDATILIEEAPDSLVQTVALIPGVKQAIGRKVKDGTLVLRDRVRERVMGRFIGLPTEGRTPIDDVLVVRGRYLSDRNELLLEQLFAEANAIDVGDRLTANYRGLSRDFLVVGLVASPEYLYPVPSQESPLAMPATFGVCFVQDDTMRSWLGLGRTITEVHVDCVPGTADEVLDAMEALGERYGLRSSWVQAEQPSNHLLALDLQGFQALSVLFPTLFLFAAALSLYSSLTRIVRLQTGIVGFLRASGFSARAVLWHYVLEGALVTAAGAIPGALVGHFLSIAMVGIYVDALELPIARNDPHFEVWLSAVIQAGVAGLVAAWLPARAAAKTPPAVAMRGDVLLDQGVATVPLLNALSERLPTILRIPLRGLLRRPSRTLFAVGGLVCGTAILLTTLGMYVTIHDSINEYLVEMVRYEIDVSFIAPQGQAVAMAMRGFDGVTEVARTCSAPVRIESAGGRELTTTIYGIERGQTVMGLPTLEGEQAVFRPGELWMARHSAERLGVEPGDPLRVEWSFSSRQRSVHTTMVLGGMLDITFGGFAYGDYHDLRRRLIDPVYPDSTYGALIACEPARGAAIRRQLERNSLVAWAQSTQDTRDMIDESMQITFIFIGVLLAFGAVLAGAVLHSVSSVGLLERTRELATLRSLGFSARATTAIAAFEIYLMAIAGVIAGVPLGSWMNEGFMQSYETEVFSYRSYLPPWTILVTLALVTVLVGFALRSGVQRLRTMDLAQATKARE